MSGPNFICRSYDFSRMAMDIWNVAGDMFRQKGGEVEAANLAWTPSSEGRTEFNLAGMGHVQQLDRNKDLWGRRSFIELYSFFGVKIWVEGFVIRHTDPPATVTGRLIQDTEDYSLEADQPIEANCKSLSLMIGGVTTVW